MTDRHLAYLLKSTARRSQLSGLLIETGAYGN